MGLAPPPGIEVLVSQAGNRDKQAPSPGFFWKTHLLVVSHLLGLLFLLTLGSSRPHSEASLSETNSGIRHSFTQLTCIEGM